MQVRELMSRQVVTIGTGDSCLEAVTRMQGARVRHLPVVSREGLLVGIVTDRDLRHHLFAPRLFEALGSTPVDVLLTDVVMPHMTGPDLADSLARTRPGLRVVYMSGFTDDVLDPHRVARPGTRFLPKPFTPERLLREIRQALAD